MERNWVGGWFGLEPVSFLFGTLNRAFQNMKQDGADNFREPKIMQTGILLSIPL